MQDPTACGPIYFLFLLQELEKSSAVHTEHVETLYVHKRRNGEGGKKVIILKFDYHEKDIGSTMSNQLVG